MTARHIEMSGRMGSGWLMNLRWPMTEQVSSGRSAEMESA